MPVFQAPNPPLAPANVTGLTATAGVASTGNTGSSLSSARADHAHAASIDSLRAQPYVVSGTSAAFDLSNYDDLEWNLPTSPLAGEQANPVNFPNSRQTYYCTLDIQFTAPNTLQRPQGRLIFKQPATGQITHYIRINTPAWATGGVKGLTTITPYDATGKTLAQGGTADPPYTALVLVAGVADPVPANNAFRSQIYQFEFTPLYNGSSWTLVIGAKSNMAGGGLVLQGGAPYTVGGGGNIATGLSLETAGDVLFQGNMTANGASIYSVSSYYNVSDGYNYRNSATPVLNPTTPSTGIPTYFNQAYSTSVQHLTLPQQASVGFAFVAQYQRLFGQLVVRQPLTGQETTSLSFYYIEGNWANGLRGITTLSNPNDANSALTSTFMPTFGSIVRDPLSPDLNPTRGPGAVTVYDYQYINDESNRYVYIKKRPALAVDAGNMLGVPQVPAATSGQTLVVDSTGTPVWADRVPRVCSVTAVSMVNVNLAATTAPVIDGVTQSNSTTQYYLLAAQSSTAMNGLWQAVTNSSGVPTWTRRALASGANTILTITDASPFETSFIVTVSGGDTRAGTTWAVWMPNGGTLGTTPIYVNIISQPSYTGAIAALGTASIGTSTLYARGNHVHPHGAQAIGDGTNHAVATTSFAGFMSSGDKTKLDAIPTWTSTRQIVKDGGVVTPGSSVTAGFALAMDSGSSLPLWTSPRQIVKDGGVATPGTAVSAGNALYMDSSGNPSWDRRVLITTGDQNFTTTATNLASFSLGVGLWCIEVDGRYWGSAAGTGCGFAVNFSGGTATLTLAGIVVFDSSGVAQLSANGDTTTFGNRIGTSGGAPTTVTNMRPFRGTAIVNVTVAGTCSLAFAAASGTLSIRIGARTRWDQIS